MQIKNPMPETSATIARAKASSRRSRLIPRPPTQLNDSVTGLPSSTPPACVIAQMTAASGAVAATANPPRPNCCPAATMAMPMTRWKASSANMEADDSRGARSDIIPSASIWVVPGRSFGQRAQTQHPEILPPPDD